MRKRVLLSCLLVASLFLSSLGLLPPADHVRADGAADLEVYLSQLDWTALKNGKVATRKDMNASGRPLTMNGKTYEKGIGSHPDASITYDLGGAYKRFTSIIGIDDQALENTKYPTNIKFAVYGDGVQLYESPNITANPYVEPIAIDLDVSGVHEFQLVLTGHAAGSNPQTTGYGDWADAKLYKANPTTADVAAAITSLPAPAKYETVLQLPKVPEGFAIAVHSSSREDIIPTMDAQIFPVETDTAVTLELIVTNLSDQSTAITKPIQVIVPGIPAAEEVNKTVLQQALIHAAGALENAVEGEEPGQYPKGAITALQSEIAAAERVMEDPDADQITVNAAASKLNQALTKFLESVHFDEGSMLESVILTADKSVLNLDGLAKLTITGKLKDGSDADLSKANIVYSASNANRIASIVPVNGGAEARAGTKLNSAGAVDVTASVTMNGSTKTSKVSFTVEFKADRPWQHNYHQTLTMKMFMASNTGSVSMTFEQALESIRKIDQLTRGIPKIIYLVGWQFDGHDTGYPALNVVNPKLKRAQDEKAEDSLIWLMDEALQYNTTVSLHINLLDASKDSPLWDEYLEKDVIAKELDGTLRTYVWGYPISYTKEWEAGLTQRRIDQLLELLPIERAGTIHVDAFHQNIPGMATGYISPYHGITSQEEAETQKKIIRYFADKGIDFTSEFDKNYRVDPLIGLQPLAWHIRWNASEQFGMPPSLYIGGDGGYDLLGTGMLGEGTIKADRVNLKGFLEEFALKTVPWYFLNRLDRVSNQQGVKVTFSNHVTSEKAGGAIVIKQGDRILRDGNDVFFPALWNEDKGLEMMAYSQKGYTRKAWLLPEEWADVVTVDVYAIGLDGLSLIHKDQPVEDGALTLSLEAGQGVSIFPSEISDVVRPGAFQLLTPANEALHVDPEAAALSWEAASDAHRYRVTVAEDPQFASVVDERTVTAASVQLSGLSTDKRYYWKVVAINDETGGTTVNLGGVFTFTTKFTISARDVADALTAIEAPASGATSLQLPAVPSGFAIAIKSTDRPDVIQTDGAIVPPANETMVSIVLEITRISDGLTALTEAISVLVPAADSPKALLYGADSIHAGGKFELMIGARHLKEAVYGIDITIDYDPDKVAVQQVSSAKEGLSIVETSDGNGRLQIIAAILGDERASNPNGDLIKVQWSAKSGAVKGATTISLSEMTVADGVGTETRLEGADHDVFIAYLPGDVTGNGSISVGDLAVIASAYGKKFGDSDWEQVKHADLNDDGVIDIEDLAEMARLILEWS